MSDSFYRFARNAYANNISFNKIKNFIIVSLPKDYNMVSPRDSYDMSLLTKYNNSILDLKLPRYIILGDNKKLNLMIYNNVIVYVAVDEVDYTELIEYIENWYDEEAELFVYNDFKYNSVNETYIDNTKFDYYFPRLLMETDLDDMEIIINWIHKFICTHSYDDFPMRKERYKIYCKYVTETQSNFRLIKFMQDYLAYNDMKISDDVISIRDLACMPDTKPARMIPLT